MTIIKALIAIYVLCVICTAIAGLGFMISFCEYGRKDEYYITGKNLLKRSIIFPYAVYKVIKDRLDQADRKE